MFRILGKLMEASLIFSEVADCTDVSTLISVLRSSQDALLYLWSDLKKEPFALAFSSMRSAILETSYSKKDD